MKKNEFDKVRDHCRLTGKFRGSGHNKCYFNVTQKESIFFPFLFHKFNFYDCHLIFKKLVEKKID